MTTGLSHARYMPAPRLGDPWRRMVDDMPLFVRLGLVLAFLMVPMAVAMALDPRSIDGASTWLKPMKFAAALSVYVLTLAFYARWAPPAVLRSRAMAAFCVFVALCILAEMAWIGGAAMAGTTSHYNDSTRLMAALYPLMGFFAVSLTSASLVLGIVILRARPDGVGATIGLSLVATFATTVVVAGTLSQLPGHFVGTPVTGASVPVLGWSREVGDPRAAHFLATHLMHLIPLSALALAAAGLRITRGLALGLAGLWVLLTLAIFAQAMAGRPLIPV